MSGDDEVTKPDHCWCDACHEKRTNRKSIQNELRTLGCTNHGCVIVERTGMGTNGGCHCLEGLTVDQRRRVKRALTLYRKLVEKV